MPKKTEKKADPHRCHPRCSRCQRAGHDPIHDLSERRSRVIVPLLFLLFVIAIIAIAFLPAVVG